MSELFVRLSGFGQVGYGDARVRFVPSVNDVAEALASADRPVVLHGSGRSYGDAAWLREARTFLFGMPGTVLPPDPQGVMTVPGPLPLDEIWKQVLPLGYWLPVVSGTAAPTVAGALAMNIHGKNAFHAGTLGEHVLEVQAVFPGQSPRWLKPEDPDFWAVVGGAGLIGCITAAKILMKPVPSAFLQVQAKKVRGWSDTLALFDDLQHEDYAVAWVDMVGPVRSVYHSARYLAGEEKVAVLPQKSKLVRTVAQRVLKTLNTRTGMGLINAVKFGLSKDHQFRQSLPEFQFLLDAIPGWEAIYRPHGFFQVQVFVPAAKAGSLFDRITQLVKDHHQEPFLAVLKRHRLTDAPAWALNYTVDGFSLAMDFPRRPNDAIQTRTIERIVEAAIDHGAKFYLAKDQVLTADEYQAAMGREAIQQFREQKARLDPRNVLQSQQGRRLGLVDASILPQ